jgi:methyl-accepting chemotaxis protein
MAGQAAGQFRNGSQIADNTAKALQQIVGDVSRVTDLAAEIAAAAGTSMRVGARSGANPVAALAESQRSFALSGFLRAIALDAAGAGGY